MGSLKKAIVVHSGGMDSSLCLALAIQTYQKEEVLSLSFSYNQRHSTELAAAQKICRTWGVDHATLDIPFLSKITKSALTDSEMNIENPKGAAPNTLVSGRNGLMARIAAIHADSLGAERIYLGVMELEEANSGYRDCNSAYFDLIERSLQIDFDNPNFQILTPLVQMTKAESMKLGDDLGVLDFLIEETITCYEGLKHPGCGKCPACILRNDGIKEYQAKS